jgi:hypothetical protein
LEIKEMSIEEKYDKLLDNHVSSWITNIALYKELGVLDKYHDFTMKLDKKMIPNFLGPIFKLGKAIAPGRTFKQLVEQMVYSKQICIPLSNNQLSWVSDREVVIRVKNCPLLLRSKDFVKKSGLNVNPEELCDDDIYETKEIAKELGVDITCEHTENGCSMTAKLK